ncbi:MAG: hypothetical protein ACRDIY_11565, partial [Chloroflexota bacterium]
LWSEPIVGARLPELDQYRDGPVNRAGRHLARAAALPRNIAATKPPRTAPISLSEQLAQKAAGPDRIDRRMTPLDQGD